MMQRFAILILPVLLGACGLTPRQVTEVDVPNSDATVRVEVWSNGLFGFEYRIAVETPRGRAEHQLFKDFEPAQRVNLYRTPAGAIVAIGGPGNSVMFSVEAGRPPRWIPHTKRPKTDGNEWTYIGVVDGHRQEFRPPNREQECIPLYGGGPIPYRQSHQSEHSCR